MVLFQHARLLKLMLAITLTMIAFSGCHEPVDGETIDGVKYFLHSNGEIKAKISVNEKGQRHGVALFYSEYGNLTQEENYVNGTLQGQLINYHGDSKIEDVYYFENGKRQGEYIGYYSGGEVRAKGQFVNDLAEGMWYYYDEDEKLTLEARYRNGNRDSYVEYNSSGEIIRRSATIDVWSSSQDPWMVSKKGTIALSTQHVYGTDSAKVKLNVVCDGESFEIKDSTINGISYHDFSPAKSGKYVVTASVTDWANSPEVVFYAYDTLVIDVR